MRSIVNRVVRFLKNEDGPTAVEYAVMLSLVIVVCLISIRTLGANTNSSFSFVGERLKAVGS